jgi:hypothetical protein
MATFTGTAGIDVANATAGTITDFPVNDGWGNDLDDFQAFALCTPGGRRGSDVRSCAKRLSATCCLVAARDL